MAKRQSLLKLEYLLSTKAAKLGVDGASSVDIIESVKVENPGLVEEVKEDLFRIAMGRILNRSTSKPPPSIQGGQLSIFDSFNVPLQIRVRDVADKPVYKNLDRCTVNEVRSYMDSLSNRRRGSSRRDNLFKMLSDLEPYAKSDQDVIGECWKASLIAQSKRAS